MAFKTFLTQCQKMLNIYEKEGEEMSDEAKVRFLFRKVHHSGLRSSIDALKATQTTGTVISYTMAAKKKPLQFHNYQNIYQRVLEMCLVFKLVAEEEVVKVFIMRMDLLTLGTFLIGSHSLSKNVR